MWQWSCSLMGTHSQQMVQQVCVFVQRAFALCELWQAGDGCHEATSRLLHQLVCICIRVHVGPRLGVDLFDRLHPTDTPPQPPLITANQDPCAVVKWKSKAVLPLLRTSQAGQLQTVMFVIHCDSICQFTVK